VVEAGPKLPLRILYLSWRDREHPEAGGSETFVERTAEILAEHGHRVTLFTARFPGATRTTWHDRVRVVRAGSRFGVYARALAHLARHRTDYDLVLDVQNGVPFWSPLLARVPVVNIVHHVHQDQWPMVLGRALGAFGWFLESRVAPWAYRNCAYVTVSEATRTDLAGLGVDPGRVRVIYSGNDHPADLETYAAVPRSPEPSLMVLGRLVPHKHNEVAIDVVKALSDRYPTLHLHIVGSGYWEDHLRTHAVEAGVADRVHFHGFVEEHEKHRLLAQSWVVLMPSQKEGWGLTIVEAGLHATPAIAFAYAGGVTESIVAGETGLLARDVDELVAQVDGLIADGHLRGKYGDNARRHARSFSWERTGTELERHVRSVVAAAS
jgi:glycosyltransferase involved in cell wall biosynthesis